MSVVKAVSEKSTAIWTRLGRPRHLSLPMDYIPGRPIAMYRIGQIHALIGGFHLKMGTLITALTTALLAVAAHAQSNPSLATSRGQRTGYPYKEMKPGIKRKWTTSYTGTKTKHTMMRSKAFPCPKKSATPERTLAKTSEDFVLHQATGDQELLLN